MDPVIPYMAAYELVVTVVTLVLWEVAIAFLQFAAFMPIANYIEVSPGTIWLITLGFALLFSVFVDVTQIFLAGGDDPVRGFQVLFLRFAINILLYTIFLAGANAWIPDMAEEGCNRQTTANMVLNDALNISVGRFFITFGEIIIGFIATTMK